MISEGQRLQYLEAMGIEAWVDRSKVVSKVLLEIETSAELQELAPVDLVPERVPERTLENPRKAASMSEVQFEIGPGSGQTLLLCGNREDSSSQFASDIARSLGETPVWGWQLGAVSARGITLEGAIKDRLFTRVLLFSEVAESFPGNSEVMSSARVIHAPSLVELAKNPQQKRALWLQLARNGWCTSHA